MKTNITLKERKIIKTNLKFGDIVLIARLSKKSVSTVKRWFMNQCDCFEIPNAINNLYKNRQKTLKSFKKSLDSIS